MRNPPAAPVTARPNDRATATAWRTAHRPKPPADANTGPRWLTLAEHEAETAAAVRSAFPTADANPSRGLVRVPADEATAYRAVPKLAGCRVSQGGAGFCWFDLTPQGA